MPEFWANPKSTINPRIPKLLKLANGASCTNCGAQDGTVVAAHKNENKGIALKNEDWNVAYLCGNCHFQLDNGKDLTKQDRRNLWNAAHSKTVDFWFRSGIIGLIK